jgi:hypothetical protein
MSQLILSYAKAFLRQRSIWSTSGFISACACALMAENAAAGSLHTSTRAPSVACAGRTCTLQHGVSAIRLAG